jgi:hypothetical protein
VKDREVARRMTKFVELNTIGVDLQLRAAKVLRAVSDGYVDEDTDESSYIYIGWTRVPNGDHRTRAMGSKSKVHILMGVLGLSWTLERL